MVRSLPMTLLGDVAGRCCVFVVGAAAGSVIYFLEGASSSSSKGCRLAGGVQAVISNVPRVRRWAAWSGVFVTIAQGMFDTCDVGENFNFVVAGATTNALLSVHRGPRAAVRSGLKGVAYSGVACITMYSIVRLLESVKR